MKLKGLILRSPRLFRDERGFFFESHRKEEGPVEFVQDNISYSVKDTIRGLHYSDQAKLVQCLNGKILDVVVDLREGPTYRQWEAIELTVGMQLFIPAGFAHGFCVLSDHALVHYKVSAYYNPALEKSIRWDDPDLNIPWPVKNPILSEKDRSAPCLR